ncbi:MAG: sugar ABC transporter substrate-binding protein [Chloroflexi bacterium]|nr:sugar ABC transporter substrate-binding protein [Chloroflexota bacterium]
MSRKIQIGLSFFLIAAFVLAGCQSATPQPVQETVVVTQMVAGTPVIVTATPQPTADLSQQPVKLRFTVWTGNDQHLKLLNGIASDYTAQHPNVTIQFDTIPFDDYVTKVTVELAGNNPPDAGWLMETAAPSFVDAGVLADLMPTLNSYPNYDFADFPSSVLSLWQKDNAVYGVPFSNSPIFVAYNKDLFTAAGASTPDEMIKNNEWTWENLAKVAKQIKDKGPAGSYGFVGFDAEMFTAQPWSTMVPVIWAYGGNAWSEDGKTCMINQPEAVKAIQLLHDMTFKDGSIVPPGNQTAFASGSVGMTLVQLSRLTQLADAPFKFGIAPLPSGPAGNKAVIGQAAIVVFDKSPNKSVAEDFVAFMTTKENFAKMAAFFPPARSSVLDSGILAQENPNLDPAMVDAAIVNGIKTGSVLPSHVNFPKIDLAMRADFDKLWTADANVQDVLNQACQDSAAYFQ